MCSKYIYRNYISLVVASDTSRALDNGCFKSAVNIFKKKNKYYYYYFTRFNSKHHGVGKSGGVK